MTVATALVSGNEPLPYLAEQAVAEALKKAGLTHANSVLLFLSPEFARHAQHTVTAVARAAQCMQVAGGIASGVFTEAGWAVDRPAVAVMVFGGGLSLGHAEPGIHPEPPILSYAGDTFPPEWETAGTRAVTRFGASFSGNFSGNFSSSSSHNTPHTEPLVWQQSRLNEQQRCSIQLLGANVDIGVSSGLKLLGNAQRVEQSNGFDLERVGGQHALKNLIRCLTPELRNDLKRHLHHLVAIILDAPSDAERALAAGCYRPVALISANPDSSLTLADRIEPGQRLCWAIRQPDAAEADMRRMLDVLAEKAPAPSCALMFSCIGRGPYFYGGDDRDLALLRQHFPGLPVLGTYSTGQIAPSHCGSARNNRLLQNSVVTALVRPIVKEAHVQSIT